MNDNFYIGQKFYQIYPPEAATWCQNNNAEIDEKYESDGTRYYEIVEIPEPTPEEIKRRRIAELKQQLNDTDYKIIKCTEYQMAGLDLPYDIEQLHIQRQALRDEINELEG